MRSERRLREGESQIFKLTCIPTLLAAPPPKQYSTTTLIPPATQATGIATEKYKINQIGFVLAGLCYWPQKFPENSYSRIVGKGGDLGSLVLYRVAKFSWTSSGLVSQRNIPTQKFLKYPFGSVRVSSLNFKTWHFALWGKSHVAVGISLLYLHFLCCCHRFNSSLCHSQCRHFRCPMLLFQGRVACRNLTQTGPGW